MTKQKDDIISKFKEYFQEHGGAYSDWYVGISEDVERRLFQEHRVDKDTDSYLWRTALSSEIARSVEKYFLDLGSDGGVGGGDKEAKIVYGYKKNWKTKP